MCKVRGQNELRLDNGHQQTEDDHVADDGKEVAEATAAKNQGQKGGHGREHAEDHRHRDKFFVEFVGR